MICEKGLGHFDNWLQSGSAADLDSFVAITRWLLETQDSLGAWVQFRCAQGPTYDGVPVGVPCEWVRASTPYSGMGVGLAISILVRAYSINHANRLLSAAQRGYEVLRRPTSKGGVCAWVGQQTSIEEVPKTPRNTILNGWLFGIFGARDLWLANGSTQVREFVEANCRSLVFRLPEFELPWWSKYDEAGHVAKPSYQLLHACQLAVLDTAEPQFGFGEISTQWFTRIRWGNTLRALAEVAVQRLSGSASVFVTSVHPASRAAP